MGFFIGLDFLPGFSQSYFLFWGVGPWGCSTSELRLSFFFSEKGEILLGIGNRCKNKILFVVPERIRR